MTTSRARRPRPDPLLGAALVPAPVVPWERRDDWQAAALAVALVLVPEALQPLLAPDDAGVVPRDPPPLRSRRVGRRPGVRPPRSC